MGFNSATCEERSVSDQILATNKLVALKKKKKKGIPRNIVREVWSHKAIDRQAACPD